MTKRSARVANRRALALAVAVVLAAAAPRAVSPVSRDSAREIVAVSLRSLQEGLASPARSAQRESALRLGGLTRIDGYVLDNEGKDLVVFGVVEPRAPGVWTEDFAVALRNAWLRYSTVRGNTRYVEDPGCSIDPRPDALVALNRSARLVHASTTPAGTERAIRDWESSCRRPQDVRVLGVPFDCRFAKAMVVADYHMKRLANGTDSVRVRGFASLTRLLRERVRSAEAGGSGSIELSPLDRFWFESGRCTFEEDEGIARLTVCTVVLRTQEQHVSSSGQATDTGRQNALAEEFAREFTAHYSEISGQRTEYSELEALFRLVALARILKTSVGESHVSSLLSSYPLPLTTHPRQLPGLSHVERVYQRWSNPRGYSEQRLWIPSCGGVTMNVRPARETASTTRRSELRRLKSAVLKSRPGPRALAWKVAGVS